MRREVWGIFLLATACATYTPAPVSPEAQLEPYNRRSLADSSLLSWFDTLGVARPSDTWTPRQLAIAAGWFRSERTVRAAEVRAADAAVVTAGGRPQPGVATDLEYAFSDPQASSRWGVALAGLFTVELGGKRSARIGRARAAALVVRASAAEAEWEQVGRIYSAVLDWQQAGELVEAEGQEEATQDSLYRLTEARFQGGTLTGLDLSRALGEQRAALAAQQAAERERAMALAHLTRTTGLPGTLEMKVGPLHVPACSDYARDSLQRAALSSRWSVRRAAAEYQVAEGDLRVAVANASPDLTIGPGLFFDQGAGKFTLGLGFPSLALNRNRGPIGEAEAGRVVAAARLMQAQETVLSEVDAALAGCGTARGQILAADSLTRQAEQRLQLVDNAYRRGEIGHLEAVTARLDLIRVRRATMEARFRQEQAGLALERAIGAYGVSADGPWPTLPY